MNRVHTLGLIALGALLVTFVVLATSPSLVATNNTTPLHVSGGTNFVANTGSPSANDLDVIIGGCLDNTDTTNPAMTTPSGWQQELHSTGNNAASHFGDSEVIWKIASGSEGSTVNIPITSMTAPECVAQYWKFTGYDASNPIDCTASAWADNSTYDPPSQSVTNGPLDVYVIAWAHSRGDESYSSGSDLTTNAHIDAGGISAGRSQAVSYGAYSSISSKDPGAFVIGGANRYGNAITCVIYPAATTHANPICGPLCGPVGGPAQ